jgi:hypothetical protein
MPARLSPDPVGPESQLDPAVGAVQQNHGKPGPVVARMHFRPQLHRKGKAYPGRAVDYLIEAKIPGP